MLKRKFRSSRGDTIIEVLVVIAVISLVLGGAYSSARRSLVSTQQSRERGESLKLLEQQIELLKAASDSRDTQVYAPNLTGTFCLSESLEIQTPSCARGVDNRYNITIQRLDPSTRSFRVVSSWERAGGGGNDNITTYYKVYPRRLATGAALPSPPADACPNILGYQPIIPPGMVVDGSGNCVTAPPPPPPAPEPPAPPPAPAPVAPPPPAPAPAPPAPPAPPPPPAPAPDPPPPPPPPAPDPPPEPVCFGFKNFYGCW